MRLRLPEERRRSRRPNTRSSTRCCPRTAPGPGSPVCRSAARCRTEPGRRVLRYGLRHRCTEPPRDCGFHCVTYRAAAEALLCTAEHAAVLLEVSSSAATSASSAASATPASGCRTATVGPCACGTVAAASPTPTGADPAGWPWRPPARAACAAVRPSRSPGSRGWPGRGCGWLPGRPGAHARCLGMPERLGVLELVAEAALLQARLDWFQSQLARLGQRGPDGGPQG